MLGARALLTLVALAAAVAAVGPSHAECAALTNGCGLCLAQPGCAFCAHDGDSASFIPEDLSGLWRFKQTHSRLSRGGAAVAEDHRELLGASEGAGKAASRHPATAHRRLVQDGAALLEVGAHGAPVREARAGFCFSTADAGKGLAPPGAVTASPADGSRWVCLDSRDRACDCDDRKNEFACSAPRSAGRLVVAGLFLSLCIAVLGAGCVWATKVDVGSWFARSRRWQDEDDVAMAADPIRPRSP